MRMMLLCWLAMGGFCLAAMQISSPDFAAGGAIPNKYSRGKGNVSPALKVDGIPEAAKSLALIVDDPDAPTPKFTHWLVWNINTHHVVFLEGRPPRGAEVGTNSFGRQGYDGPQPPSGTHRYFFRLFALDSVLKLEAGADRAALEAAMQGHVIAKAEMFGTYSRR